VLIYINEIEEKRLLQILKISHTTLYGMQLKVSVDCIHIYNV